MLLLLIMITNVIIVVVAIINVIVCVIVASTMHRKGWCICKIKNRQRRPSVPFDVGSPAMFNVIIVEWMDASSAFTSFCFSHSSEEFGIGKRTKNKGKE